MDDSVERMQMTQQMEQHGAGLIEFAEVIGSYFRALRRQGFDRAEAMTLTASYQQMMFASALGRPSSSDGA